MASGTNSLWTRRKTTPFRTSKRFLTCHLYSHGLSVYPMFILKNRPQQILKRQIPWNFWPYGGWLRNPAPPWMVETCWNPINNGINHLWTGAGLEQPSDFSENFRPDFPSSRWTFRGGNLLLSGLFHPYITHTSLIFIPCIIQKKHMIPYFIPYISGWYSINRADGKKRPFHLCVVQVRKFQERMGTIGRKVPLVGPVGFSNSSPLVNWEFATINSLWLWLT